MNKRNMSDKMDNFENTFRKLQLEDDVTLHLHSKENRKALAVLRELRSLQSNEDVVTKFYFMTLESECHLNLEEYSAAIAVFHEIDKLLTSSNVMPDDVNTMAKKFQDKKMYSRAYIAFHAACKLYLIKSANDAASKITSAFDNMQNMAKEMEKSTNDKNVLTKHIMPAMRKVVEELVAMPANGNNGKVRQQAWCYYYIALCYSYIKDNEQRLAMNKAAIDLMEAKLGGDAEKFQVTGRSYSNAGFAYKALELRDKAIEAFKTAIRIKEKAMDFPNEKSKEESIEISRKELNELKK